MKSNGYTLHSDAHRVVVATGFSRPSANGKTGPMIQVWILARQQDPLSAIRSGHDATVCGGCPLRGDGRGKERACYVDLGKAPLAIWRAWHRGAYPQLPFSALADTFQGRSVRFGSYGDPVFIPFSIVAEIARVARMHTGYSHQWHNPLFGAFRAYFHASVESAARADQAQGAGWNTFRVAPLGSIGTLENESVCPASVSDVACVDCGRCAGAGRGNVVIEAHGGGAKYVPEVTR